MKLSYMGFMIIMLIIFFVSFFFFVLFFDSIMSLNPHQATIIEEYMKHIFFGYMAFLGGIYFYICHKYDLLKSISFKPAYWYIYWPIISIAGLLYTFYKFYHLIKILS